MIQTTAILAATRPGYGLVQAHQVMIAAIATAEAMLMASLSYRVAMHKED